MIRVRMAEAFDAAQEAARWRELTRRVEGAGMGESLVLLDGAEYDALVSARGMAAPGRARASDPATAQSARMVKSIGKPGGNRWKVLRSLYYAGAPGRIGDETYWDCDPNREKNRDVWVNRFTELEALEGGPAAVRTGETRMGRHGHPQQVWAITERGRLLYEQSVQDGGAR